MLSVVTGYRDSNENLCNPAPDAFVALHHFVIFISSSEGKNTARYKVSLCYLIRNTLAAKCILFRIIYIGDFFILFIYLFFFFFFFAILILWVYPSLCFYFTLPIPHLAPLRPQQPDLPVAAFQPYWFEKCILSQCLAIHML